MVEHGAMRDFLLLSKDLLQNHDDGMIYFDVVRHALHEAYSKQQDYAEGLMCLEALFWRDQQAFLHAWWIQK